MYYTSADDTIAIITKSTIDDYSSLIAKSKTTVSKEVSLQILSSTGPQYAEHISIQIGQKSGHALH